MIDRNCLSYWFQRLRDAGLPVPRTEIVQAGHDLEPLLDGRTPTAYYAFLADLSAAVERIGLPCFLRTGHTSAKFGWKDTCYLEKLTDLPRHVTALVEFSALADFCGLPTRVWAVREMLPTLPQFTAFRGQMPICREFRFFAKSGINDSGIVQCVHPYWPKESLEEGFALLPSDWDWRYHCLTYLPGVETPTLYALARAAAQALGGAWSIDLIETKRGWVITDCAEAERSWHWPDCPFARKAVAALPSAVARAATDADSNHLP